MSVGSFVTSPRFLVASGLVLAVAGGAAGGYLVGAKRTAKYLGKVHEVELEAQRNFYAKKYKADEYDDLHTLAEQIPDEVDEIETQFTEVEEPIDPIEAARRARKIVDEQAYLAKPAVAERVAYDKMATEFVTPVAEPQTEKQRQATLESIQTAEVQNVWENPEVISDTDELLVSDLVGTDLTEVEFDESAELDKKAQTKPFIVDEATFMENEDDWPISQLTMYADGVLADEQERAIDRWTMILGDDNLKFGYGSNDPTVVYIANPKYKGMYEVTRVDLKYAEEISGFRHNDSRSPGLRKFRARED